jgi:hypothetical protein
MTLRNRPVTEPCEHRVSHDGFKSILMKMIVLGSVLPLARCVMSNRSTTETNARLIKFQNQSEEISQREQQCIKEAVSRTNDQATQVARPDALAGQVAQQADADEDHEILQCKDAAQRDQAKLAARARAEYEDEALQQRDRVSLMAILTTPRPQ